MPEVSVIIPCYNRGEWLGEAVRSVLAQSYQDFEILVVDDGSTEDVAAALDLSDRRVRYVRQENRGPAAARNHGIDLAQGKYVAFLDADDRFLPNKLEVQVAQMESRPAVLLSHTSYRRVGSDGTPMEPVPAGRFTGEVFPTICLNCPIATPTVMVRHAALQELRFEEGLRVGEDTVLWVRLARRGPILGIDQMLTEVRMHGQNWAAVFDAQIAVRESTIRYGLHRDGSLPARQRRRLEAAIRDDMARLYLRHWEDHWGLKFASRLLWNLNCRIIGRILRKGFDLVTKGQSPAAG